MFPNVDKISKIRVPIYITHGRTDKVVPFWHAEELYRLATGYKEQHWIDGSGHNDMPDVWQYQETPRATNEPEAKYKTRCDETKAQNLLNKEHKRRLKAFIQKVMEYSKKPPVTDSSIIINEIVSSTTPSSQELKEVIMHHEERSGTSGRSSTGGLSPTSGDKNLPNSGDLESSASKAEAESDSSDEGEV